jgi:hypothetical protein
MPVRKRNTSGGAGTIPQPVNSYTEEESRTSTGFVSSLPALQAKSVKQAPKEEPVPPFRILTTGPEFEAAIAQAPTFSKLRSELSSYHMDYMLNVLQSFNFEDCHKAYTTETMERTCFVYVVSQLVARLEQEIDNIMNTSESLGYTFSSRNAAIVIEELKKYIEYIQRNNTGWDRINIDFIEAITN